MKKEKHNCYQGTDVKNTDIIKDHVRTMLVNQGRICHDCGTLFNRTKISRSKAKHPVHNEKKRIKHYICSECKFRN